MENLIKKPHVIPLLAFICVFTLLFVKAIPQDENYHDFADRRNFSDIPNFLNVITNIPFAIVAFSGLQAIKHLKEKKLRSIFFTLFIGCLLLTFGSGYYHWAPSNDTLVYDRIPIVIILMSFFAFIIYTCIDRQAGYKLFFILNIVGVISVVYWGVTETTGKGDLRWYGLVQFFPVLAIPLILILYKPSLKFKKNIILILLFFGVAKLAERYDYELYQLLNHIISGHSLKHLFMIGALYGIISMMRIAA